MLRHLGSPGMTESSYLFINLINLKSESLNSMLITYNDLLFMSGILFLLEVLSRL